MGWKWEPKAPQMPHMNNIDLDILPAMPKRHIALIKAYSNKMAPADEIWQACNSVQRDIDYVSIHRGYILMHSITENFIVHKGTNKLLHTIDCHSGVRNSFANTLDGVKPKVNVLD